MLFLLFALAFSNNLHTLPVDKAWARWQVMYNDTQTFQQHVASGSLDMRRDIFALNHAYVKEHNSQGHSWTLELNEFAAMDNEEWRYTRHGYKGEPLNLGEAYVMSGLKNPSSVDWRGKLVNPIKNQASCGSCWTFSAVASLEGQYAKMTETLVEFSEQDLVDCVKGVRLPGSYQTCCSGCSGGLMDYGFYYLQQEQNGADDYESQYPYTARDGSCKYSASKAPNDAKVTGYTDIRTGSETQLEDATANVGPISVAVNAAGIGWQLYKSGVYSPSSCNPNNLDHGVAVVGYGTDGDDYWIIRNSWGTSWGENGYMRLEKGGNTCGVAQSASYPKMSL